mgnify:CR=1 FL=1
MTLHFFDDVRIDLVRLADVADVDRHHQIGLRVGHLGNLLGDHQIGILAGDADGLATLPPNTTLTNGAGVFSVALQANGPETLTATDTVTGSIAGTSGNVNVTAAAATHYTLNAPGTASAPRYRTPSRSKRKAS